MNTKVGIMNLSSDAVNQSLTIILVSFQLARDHLNISQAEMGKKLGITGPHISYIESGKREPSIKLIKKLIKLLREEGF